MIGILQCGDAPAALEPEFGSYAGMVARVLGPDLLHTDNLHWHVRITSANRDRLLALAEAYELPERVVHMSLTTAQGHTFFRGEDHLDTIICDIDFQDLRRVCRQFPNLELSIVEMEGPL